MYVTMMLLGITSPADDPDPGSSSQIVDAILLNIPFNFWPKDEGQVKRRPVSMNE